MITYRPLGWVERANRRSIRSTPTGLGPSPGIWVLVAIGCALVGVIVASGSKLLLLALALLVLVAAPEVSVLATAVLIEQELASGTASNVAVSPLVSVGSKIYTATLGGVRLLGLAVLLAALIALVRRRPRCNRIIVCLLGGLSLWSLLLALVEGYNIRSTISAAMPWLVILGAYILGASVGQSRQRLHRASIAVGAMLIAKATVALATVAMHETQSVGSVHVVYYDSAISLLAAAAILGVAVAPMSLAWKLPIALAGMTILVTSFRRNVLLAAGCAVAAMLLQRAPRKAMARALVTAVLVGGCIVALRPHILSPMWDSLWRAIGTVSGADSADQSTVGHLQDLKVGYDLTRSHWLFGLNVFAAPQPGLVVGPGQSSLLYIHDEYLQIGANLGVLAIATFIALEIVGLRYALKSIRAIPSSLALAICSVLLLSIPVSLLFFADISSLLRYDILLGVALGVVSTSLSPPAIPRRWGGSGGAVPGDGQYEALAAVVVPSRGTEERL